MHRSRWLGPLVICLTLALASSSATSPACAQERESGAIKPGENHRRATGILEAFAGGVVAFVGTSVALTAGFGLGFAASRPDADGNRGFLSDRRGQAVALGSSVGLFYLLVPASTALAVHGVARARGLPGTYRGAWLGSLVTSAAVGLPWLALNGVSSMDPEGRWLGSVSLTLGTGFFASVVGARLGERRSRARTLRTTLLPSVSPHVGGLQLQLCGQF